MAKRITKTETSPKQTASVRRTKKEATLVKKAPVKKTATEKPLTATSGKTKTVKTVKTAIETAPPVVHLAINGNEMPQKTDRQPRSKNSVFVRILSTASREEYDLIGLRVKGGELQWAYFAIDGDKAYHHYRVLK